MKKLLILTLLGVLFVPMNGSAKADEVLYCQSEVETGLVEKNGTWKERGFVQKTYTINFSRDYKKMKGLDNKILGDLPCFTYPHQDLKNSHICRSQRRDVGETFIFDSESKRFFFLK